LVFFHATGCEAHPGLQSILGGTFHTVDISISKSEQHQAPQPRMLETTAVMGFPNVHVFALSPQGSSPPRFANLSRKSQVAKPQTLPACGI